MASLRYLIDRGLFSYYTAAVGGSTYQYSQMRGIGGPLVAAASKSLSCYRSFSLLLNLTPQCPTRMWLLVVTLPVKLVNTSLAGVIRNTRGH